MIDSSRVVRIARFRVQSWCDAGGDSSLRVRRSEAAGRAVGWGLAMAQDIHYRACWLIRPPGCSGGQLGACQQLRWS